MGALLALIATSSTVVVWADVTPPDASVPTGIEVHRSMFDAAAFLFDAAMLTREQMIERRLLDVRRRCGADVACLGRALAEGDVDVGVAVTVDGALTPPLVTARLIERGANDVAGVSIAQAKGAREILDAATRLFRERLVVHGFRLGGLLAIDVVPPNATITIDPPGRSVDDERVVLMPGLHHVRATSPDFVPSEPQLVDIEAGTASRMQIALERQRSVWASPWLWAGVVVVAAAGAAVGTWAALRPRSFRLYTGGGGT